MSKLSAWWGVGALAAGAGIGAAIGAAHAEPCGTPTSTLLCGPEIAAISGGATGVLLTGIAGLAAALSPKYRAAGLTAAGITASLFVLGGVNAALKKGAAPAPQVTP